jgi:ABC-type transport system involved in cytochrome c biogenesis permease subunit
MHIKYSIQGLLIYIALGAYILAFLWSILRLRKTGHLFFIIGFAAALLSYVFRVLQVNHVPLQNLFDVFLFLGAIIYPLSLFCRKVLKTGGSASDALIGAIILFPAGFVFPETSAAGGLPPALQSPLFAPHVAVYILAYLFMTKAAVQAYLQIIGAKYNPEYGFVDCEEATYRLACAGFPLLTLGLVIGCFWAQLAWANWWGWDPKEMWSLATWLVFAAYFNFRSLFGTKYPRLSSAWVLTGFTFIVITLLLANIPRLFPGLHNYTS